MYKRAKESINIFMYCMKVSFESSVIYTVFRLICKLAMAILPLLISYFLRNIINIMAKMDYFSYKDVIVPLLLYSASIIVNLIIANLNLYIMNMHSNLIQNYMKISIAKKVVKLDISAFDDSETYNKITNAEMNIQSTISVIWGLTDVIGSIISCIVAFCVLVKFSIWMGIIMLVISIPNAIYSQIYTKKIYKWEKENVIKQRKNQYFYSLMMSRQTCMDIRFWNINSFLMEKYIQSWEIWYREKKKLLSKRNFAQIVTNCLPFFVMGCILIFISKNINYGMSIGDFSLYASQLEQLNSAIVSLILAVISIYDNKLRVKNIIELKEVRNMIKNGSIILKDTFESIEFRNVSFTYPFGVTKVLNDISFKIYAGQKIAVIGVNGAGKTTIIKLLLRFYDPDEGEILINNENIKKYTHKSLRNIFSTFFQQCINYAFTLEENIRISDIGTNMMESLFNEAIFKSGFYREIEQLPKGKKSNITKMFDKEGVQLSAGQGQKLALARTFYRNRDVLLLDEPSSSLDPQAEYEIFDTIKKDKTKTVVFVSHRLSNIYIADKIFVIERGKIVEEGTHETLIKTKGAYYKLYFYQASKFSDIKKGEV
ncbi:ABC transporter ATP-binding protein [Candidatus Galacturonibacter soehngenii]|uniref:ABC transporter ATP-binding protein n=1 Tax=Candidatus Galacturonatibacter soehngenii TaxID=2307010 RepID=A0A7V7UC66_9FIRM|nr:ABC transporter ATP-binding protein [Candidatus Galacturonibacter soehngenii]KAB1438349.1 ABC transporter ATP-binding protein [Candidatus Galacturonibacter soehngenii]